MASLVPPYTRVETEEAQVPEVRETPRQRKRVLRGFAKRQNLRQFLHHSSEYHQMFVVCKHLPLIPL